MYEKIQQDRAEVVTPCILGVPKADGVDATTRLWDHWGQHLGSATLLCLS